MQAEVNYWPLMASTGHGTVRQADQISTVMEVAGEGRVELGVK